jgi:hypothetical protein
MKREKRNGTAPNGRKTSGPTMGLPKVAMAGLLAAAGIGAPVMMPGCGTPDGGGVIPGVEALVFVQRAYERGDGSHDISGGTMQVIDYLRYTPGGGVFVLDPPTPDGELTELTDGFTGVDIAGLDLSFDADRVVFSMRHEGDDHYHIYTTSVERGEVRQLTFGDWDDLRPIFVPGGHVAFITNQPYTAMGVRRDEYERGEAAQLAVLSLDGGEPTLCSHNLSHHADPFLLSNGQIGFSRWEHLGPRNDVKLFRMNPDCTGVEALAGEFNRPFNSLVQAHEVEPGIFYAIGTSRNRTIQSGAIFRVDARALDGSSSLFFDVQDATFDNLTPRVPTDMSSPPSGVGRYRHPIPLTDSANLLVSWSDGDVNDRNELAVTAPDYGIYMYDPVTERRTLVFDDPNMWDLYALPVAVREEPPAIPSTISGVLDPNTPAILGSIDVAETSMPETVSGGHFGTDGVPLGTALRDTVRMRIVEGFSSEIGSVRMFGLTMHEGAAILGETPVYNDGSWRAAVPAYLPYHLQPLDEYGVAIRNQMLWIQAMPGESRECGGCHSDRSESVLPRSGLPTTLAQAAGADMTTFRPIADRMELPWAGAPSRRTMQDMFNENCISCHDGGASDPYASRNYMVEVETMDGEMLAYTIPYLRLTDEPIEVYYENEVRAYPASYVTLLYPSAMMGDMTIVGEAPPQWVVPGSARHSRLVEVVNAESEVTPGEFSWTTPAHPEDLGVELSREDRMMMIRMSDLGGQYYSRWNVAGGERFTGMTSTY